MYKELASFPRPLPLPLQPDVVATGIKSENSGVFNSAMAPLKLCFCVRGSASGASNTRVLCLLAAV